MIRPQTQRPAILTTFLVGRAILQALPLRDCLQTHSPCTRQRKAILLALTTLALQLPAPLTLVPLLPPRSTPAPLRLPPMTLALLQQVIMRLPVEPTSIPGPLPHQLDRLRIIISSQPFPLQHIHLRPPHLHHHHRSRRALQTRTNPYITSISHHHNPLLLHRPGCPGMVVYPPVQSQASRMVSSHCKCSSPQCSTTHQHPEARRPSRPTLQDPLGFPFLRT